MGSVMLGRRYLYLDPKEGCLAAVVAQQASRGLVALCGPSLLLQCNDIEQLA